MKAYDIKKGNVVEHNGTVYQIRDIERSAAQGRSGNVTFRFIMYSVPGGNKFDLSLRSEDELKEVELVRREANYSYKDGEAFVFMDKEDYTPYQLDADVVGDMAGYITEGQLYAPVVSRADGHVEVELGADHPGVNDAEYRTRRNAIAALALEHQIELDHVLAVVTRQPAPSLAMVVTRALVRICAPWLRAVLAKPCSRRSVSMSHAWIAWAAWVTMAGFRIGTMARASSMLMRSRCMVAMSWAKASA